LRVLLGLVHTRLFFWLTAVEGNREIGGKNTHVSPNESIPIFTGHNQGNIRALAFSGVVIPEMSEHLHGEMKWRISEQLPIL
jgi:hypothetical protein